MSGWASGVACSAWSTSPYAEGRGSCRGAGSGGRAQGSGRQVGRGGQVGGPGCRPGLSAHLIRTPFQWSICFHSGLERHFRQVSGNRGNILKFALGPAGEREPSREGW